MKIINDKGILGSKTNGRLTNTAGWITVAIMAISLLITYSFGISNKSKLLSVQIAITFSIINILDVV